MGMTYLLHIPDFSVADHVRSGILDTAFITFVASCRVLLMIDSTVIMYEET